jgi:hypothetical protein
MSLSATVTAMAANGCTAEQIAAVVVAHERQAQAAAEAKRALKRAGNAERQRRSRAARAGKNNGLLFFPISETLH